MERLEACPEISVDCFRKTLEATKQWWPNSRTQYSNICELRKGLVHLYYKGDFSRSVTIDLAAELALGSHVSDVSSLFSRNPWGKKRPSGFRDEDLRRRGMPVPENREKKRELLKRLNTRVDRVALEAARNNLKKVATSIEIIKTNINEATIRAPMRGMVAVRNVEIGERVRDETNLFVLMNISEVYLVVNIGEKEVGALRKNQKALFMVDAVPGKKFHGRVFLINPYLDESTRTVEVKIRTANKEQRLKPGMFARGSIIADTVKNVILIPDEALQQRGDSAQVFLLRDGHVYRKKITIGRRFEEGHEVLSGLAEGDTVVVGAVRMLSDGMSVRVKDTCPGTMK